MNLTITIPDDRRFNLDIRTSNGAILLNRPKPLVPYWLKRVTDVSGLPMLLEISLGKR
ncbi:hypothetical protein Q0F98_10450 [Paenibacillus amylolyticus]|nr:hypothetical protein Q0F98_10450 [Paenibacillus amylolyticus]